MSYCEANDLAVGYNSPLLEHIKFAAERGQILTLIGPNGAGKSTLMKTLAAQLAPQGGTVLLDGQSLSVYSPNARARKMALMVPHTNRTELTTCFDVAAAGRYPYTGRLGILSEEDKKQVFDALHLVNAADIADRDFDKISDGQRQRVLLARAVCQEPEILFLDEPTSFLDVKGKAELMTILRRLAKEKNTAIILSLHELDLAQKLSDAVVCVSPNSVSDIMTVKDAFQKENIQKLYKMSAEEYTFLFGEKEPPKFEHYIRSGQKLLRCGYTTGTCAALGAAGAARLLFTGKAPETVGLRTPKGIVVEVAPIYCEKVDTGAVCAIRKDGGDDIDATDGLPVIANVTLLPNEHGVVKIDGGKGVGRVTKPGLDQPVGAAAINHVPREMITEALLKEAKTFEYKGGFSVLVSIEGGEEAAKKTFNPHIGVIGGLSVLGTSGIVEPMSEAALIRSLELEMKQQAADGRKYLVVTLGNYGKNYLAELNDVPVKDSVKCSNYIGEVIDIAVNLGVKGLLFIAHIGKFAKVAGGIMNTHSRNADARAEIIASAALRAGISREGAMRVLETPTTDAALDILAEENIMKQTMDVLMEKISFYLNHRCYGAIETEALVFSNDRGYLGETAGFRDMVEKIKGEIHEG